MLSTTCPTSEQLADFQAGKLPLESLNAVAVHLEACDSCQTILEGVGVQGDTLVQELKQAQSEDAYANESGCRRAVAQVEALVETQKPGFSEKPGFLSSAVEVSSATKDMIAGQDTNDNLPAKMLGKYQLLEQIGQGGMGTVYKAVHTLLKRTVALKVLSPNRLSNPQAVGRFRREVEAAGRLDHPHIVRTSDADEADGQHFLVMEWLAGEDLARHVKAHGPLSVGLACDFIRQAALGLDCAHRHGLVHRDVKPSNLLLTTTEDHKPLVKVLDLGLALIHDAVPSESAVTSDGQVMGTYDYISPEQGMESHAVDARADIYSLGCTFYFLMTGKPPFQGKSEAKKLLAHQLEQPIPMTHHRADVPDDVIAVLTKMMAKDPAQRFASAGAVVLALQSLEKELPLRAGSVSDGCGVAPSLTLPARSGVCAKRPPRNRRPLLIAALLLLVALIPLGYWAFGLIRIPTEQGDYVIDTDDPDFAFRVSKGSVILEDRKTERKYQLKVAKDKGAGELELDVTDVGAELSFKTKTFTIKRGETVALKARLERRQKDQVNLVFGPVEGQGASKATLEGHTDNVRAVALSADGKTLVSGGDDQTVRLWDVATAKERATLRGHSGTVMCVAISSDGKVAASGEIVREKSAIRLWNVATGKELLTIPKGSTGILALAFSPDGKALASGQRGAAIRLWDPMTGKELALFGREHSQSIMTVAFSPDGKTLASGSMDETIIVWDVSTGKPRLVLKGHSSAVYSVAFSPDGRTLASAGSLDKTLKLWDVATGKEKRTLQGHEESVWSVAFTPDGKTLVSGSGDKTIKLWDVATGKEQRTLRGHANQVYSVAVSGDGQFLASGGPERTIHLWRLVSSVPGKDNPPPPADAGELRVYRGHVDPVNCVAFAPDGKSFLSGGRGEMFLWDIEKATPKQQFVDTAKPFSTDGNAQQIGSLAFSSDGSRALSGGKGHIARLWDLKRGLVVNRFENPKADKVVSFVAMSPDDKYILVAAEGGVIRLFAYPSLDESKDLFGGSEGHFSRAGDTLLTLEGNQLGHHHLNPLKRKAVNVKDIHHCALSPDGRYAVCGGLDSIVYVWDMTTGKEIHKLAGHKGKIQALAISPDGKRALSGAGDSLVRLWDLTAGKEIRAFEGHGAPVVSVAFAPDGRTALSAGSTDKTVRLWRLPEPPEDGKKDKNPRPADGPLALEMLTKLGVKIRVEVERFDMMDDGSPYSVRNRVFIMSEIAHLKMTSVPRICLEQDNVLCVFIPLEQVKSIEAEGKLHAVTLLDGSVQKGKPLTTVWGKDKKDYNLADAKSIKVLGLQARPPKDKPAKTVLTLPGPAAQKVRLSAFAFQVGRFRFGEPGKMLVNGESLKADLQTFDKSVVTAGKKQWGIRVTVPGGKETEGVLDDHSVSGIGSPWYLVGEATNDWLYAISSIYPVNGFTLEKIKE